MDYLQVGAVFISFRDYSPFYRRLEYVYSKLHCLLTVPGLLLLSSVAVSCPGSELSSPSV